MARSIATYEREQQVYEQRIDTLERTEADAVQRIAALDHQLSQAADTIASLEADRATWRDEAERAAQRCADMERDRALLLTYAKDHQAVKHARIGSERYWTARQRFGDAERDLIDARLLEGADDGE